VIAIVLGMTEWNHKEATIDFLQAHLLPADLSPFIIALCGVIV
jgi:hypothetical protein